MIKPGSKAWIRKMRAIIFFSRMMVLAALPMLIFQWSSGNLEPGEFDLPTRVFITPAVLILAITELLLAFAPVTENPNWSNVYPELKQRKDQ